MSIKEAVRLIIDSSELACGGEVFVTKMPVIHILDLAEVMITELAEHYGHKPDDISIEMIGTKPGEKMYEELMSLEEVGRAIELEKYFAITPAFKSLYCEISYNYPGVIANKVTNPYNSSNEQSFSSGELKEFLIKNDLLFESTSEKVHPAERYWPNHTCKR
jgi:FlaA1/EpsC-like NDP-sugar epimerase